MLQLAKKPQILTLLIHISSFINRKGSFTLAIFFDFTSDFNLSLHAILTKENSLLIKFWPIMTSCLKKRKENPQLSNEGKSLGTRLQHLVTANSH